MITLRCAHNKIISYFHYFRSTMPALVSEAAVLGSVGNGTIRRGGGGRSSRWRWPFVAVTVAVRRGGCGRCRLPSSVRSAYVPPTFRLRAAYVPAMAR